MNPQPKRIPFSNRSGGSTVIPQRPRATDSEYTALHCALRIDANSTTSSPGFNPTDPHVAHPPTPSAQRRVRINSPIASTEGPLATLSKSRRARSESFGIMRADVERHRARNSTPWNNRYVEVHHILTDAKFLVKANRGVVAVICLNVYHPYSATRGDISKLLD